MKFNFKSTQKAVASFPVSVQFCLFAFVSSCSSFLEIMNKEHNIALRPEKVIIAFDFFTVVCKLIWKFSVT